MAVGGITQTVPRLDFGHCVKFIYLINFIKGDIPERLKAIFLVTERYEPQD